MYDSIRGVLLYLQLLALSPYFLICRYKQAAASENYILLCAYNVTGGTQRSL